MNSHPYSIILIFHIFLLCGVTLMCTGWGLSIHSSFLEHNQNIHYASNVHSWCRRILNYLINTNSLGFKTCALVTGRSTWAGKFKRCSICTGPVSYIPFYEPVIILCSYSRDLPGYETSSDAASSDVASLVHIPTTTERWWSHIWRYKPYFFELSVLPHNSGHPVNWLK